MKKPFLFYGLLIILFYFPLSAQELKIRAPKLSITKETAVVTGSVRRSETCIEIRVTEIKEINGKMARVGVIDKEHMGLWLGVTVFIKYADGRKVEKDFNTRLVTGSFKEVYTDESGSIFAGAVETIWSAKLWKGKVYPQACAEWNDDGKPCEYCKRNGYHMWHLIKSTEW
ncbi:MAG: hypothetical protein ACFFDT_21420 [Candidatus Hodarchaeota archaeon]